MIKCTFYPNKGDCNKNLIKESQKAIFIKNKTL